jgi:hypothetical protein
MVDIRCFRIKRIDRPRTPPPSRESKRSPCSGMASVIDIIEVIWPQILRVDMVVYLISRGCETVGERAIHLELKKCGLAVVA